MAKSLNELAEHLKELIKDMNKNSTNISPIHAYRFNNLKISMDPTTDNEPHVIFTVGVSEVKYSISSLQRVSGSWGPDERYITKWLSRIGVVEDLKEQWRMYSGLKEDHKKLADDSVNKIDLGESK